MRKIVIVLLVLGVCFWERGAFAEGDDYTKLLLHFDGANGATNFLDDSLSKHSVIAYGDAHMDTAQSKFGGASGLFDGNGDYLGIADNADWNLGSGDFTVDFQVKFNSIATRQGLFQQRTDPYNFISFFERESEGEIGFTIFRGSPYLNTYTTGAGITTGQWYHIALVRAGEDYKIFVDGVSRLSTPSPEIWGDYTGDLTIGRNVNQLDVNNDLSGRIDEFRVSKGIARWTSDFATPTSAYPNPVPEPASMLLFGIGGLAMTVLKRKNRK